jgi:hypothetical protein
MIKLFNGSYRKGRLTCRSNGKTIIKTQYSNKDIVFKKLQQGETESSLSIGNDLKAAATDCLKNVLQKLESLLIFIIKKILGNKVASDNDVI